MHHTKKIGVFISHIYGDYQRGLCAGIIRKANEYGYLVEIFASNDGENLGDYGIGERSILQIPRPDNYAGIIFASGTYLLPSLEQDILRLLKERFTCPVVDVNQKPSFFPRIVLENNEPIKDLVLHLGNVHHYQNIYYLGCSVEPDFNIRREKAFLEGMEALKLAAADRIFSCDYSEKSLALALAQILEKEPFPQAIVCYNDRIALSVIASLKQQNIRVPEQIAITGCDMLEFGQKTSPSLTSVTFPVDELGEKAVEQLSRLFHGETVEPVFTICATKSIGNSCGCASLPHASSYFYTRELDKRIARLEKNVILDMHMSANLHGVNDIDEGMELLTQFAKGLPGCRELYLCLYEDWDRVSSHIRELTLTDETEYDSDTILLKLAIKNGKRLPECTFTKRNTLPDYLYENGSSTYIYSPLFFGKRNFGYLVLAFEKGRVYSFSFISWIMNVNSMLKNICDKKKLGLLVGRLEDIYTRDELTGLLNRQGFKLSSQPAFENAIREGMPVCAFMYDLDCLKQINDTFGHAEGNFAIQVLAHALENSIGSEDLCSRQGGDEFWVMSINCTPQKAAQLTDRVSHYLENYNKLHTKDYLIQASSGFCIRTPQSASELSEMFEEADRNMYAEKRTKNKTILKNA